MKKKSLINYWNSYYKDNKNFKESSFARFVKRKIKQKLNENKLIDIGCGNGRDSFFFSKNGFNVTAIDISKKAIINNSTNSNLNLKFLNFDIEKNTLSKKFDYIYCRFFIHAINQKAEDKLIKLIKNIKTKKTQCFFEFRNHRDEIFNLNKIRKHNDIIEFEKGHFRRIINPEEFIINFKKKLNCKIIYKKSAKNLSIVKKDNPNLSRIIFKF